MNRYEEENGPFCSTDLKPIRQSEIPTDEWIRPAPLVEGDPSLVEHIAGALVVGAVILATVVGLLLPL
jgi:hypothetical protein